MAICLDAAAIRDELPERENLTDEQVAALTALPDEELETAIREVVGDAFWQFFDETRSNAIRWLLRRHDLGDEGER